MAQTEEEETMNDPSTKNEQRICDQLHDNATLINELGGCVMTTICAMTADGTAAVSTAAAIGHLHEVLLSDVYRAHAENLRSYAAQLETKATELRERERRAGLV